MAHSNKTFSEINITPLTDIFLVLLIIMMVVAPMLQTNGIKLATPTVDSSPDVKETPKTMTLLVKQSGDLMLDDKTVAWKELTNEIRTLKATKPDGILVEVEPDTAHEWLTKAMDSAQLAGIEKVGVMLAPDNAAKAVAPANKNW